MIRAGWLYKRGAVNTAFQRRYCVLNESNLAYYKKQADSKPRGVIDLSNAVVQRAESEKVLPLS